MFITGAIVGFVVGSVVAYYFGPWIVEKVILPVYEWVRSKVGG